MSTPVEELGIAYGAPIENAALHHQWIHQASWRDLAQRKGLRVFERGEGIHLFDIHGRRYIDAMSGLVVVNIGHGRAEIAEAAAAQIRQLAYVSAANYTSIPAAELSARIAELTPGDLERTFFCSGGSEAVETALKIAKQVQFLRGFPKRYKVIARRGSYHGTTFGAMSISSNRAETEPFFGPFMYGVIHIPNVDLCLPFNPSRYSEDRLPVVHQGSWALAPRDTPVEPQTQGGGRPRNRVDRPTGAFRGAGQPAGRKDLTPPGVCTDDAGLRPWVSPRCRPGRGAPPSSPGRLWRGLARSAAGLARRSDCGHRAVPHRGRSPRARAPLVGGGGVPPGVERSPFRFTGSSRTSSGERCSFWWPTAFI